MQTYQRKLNTCYPTGHEIERRPLQLASDTKVGSGWVNVILCAMTFAWQWLVSPFTCNYCMYAHWHIHENSTVCIQRHWRRNLFHTLHCIKMFRCFRVVISKVDWSFRLIKQCRPILNAKQKQLIRPKQKLMGKIKENLVLSIIILNLRKHRTLWNKNRIN